MNRLLITTTGVSLAFFIAACSSSTTNTNQPQEKGGSSSSNAGGNKSTSAGGSSNSSNTSATNKGGDSGNNSSAQGGSGNSSPNTSAPSQGGNQQSSQGSGKGGSAPQGSGKGGATTSEPTSIAKGGATPTSGGASNGQAGKANTIPTGGGRNGQGGSSAVTPPPGGAPSTGQGGTPVTGAAGSGPRDNPTLVTSANNAWWKTDGTVTDATGNADITVSETAGQTWDGWGGAFNEMGWDQIQKLSADDQKKILQLIFGADGANFSWGRIPIGASDYATTRYTLDDTGTDIDPIAKEDESNRPEKDTSLSKFSLARDGEKLIPYIKAAQAVRADLKFWASPWTPPSWMKKSYAKMSGDPADQAKSPAGAAKRPSYFDSGNMLSDAAILTAYAEYFKKFVEGYKAQGINVEIVSAQNEPGYEQNYPSCLWDKDTYTKFLGQNLGPAMKALGVKLMLGTMSNAGDNNRNDLDIVTAVLADATAKSFVTVGGAQWGVLEKVNGGQKFGDLPIWATEHKCGNYPWNPSGFPAYNKTQAPNDLAYGVESWGYMRDAITKGKVTAYNAWNMVLDKVGLGNDTSRDWRQDSLLVVDGGKIVQTPFYYVFRHFSQFVQPGAKVMGTTGGDAVGFKNSDGSYIVVLYNKDAAKTLTVSAGGKKVSFSAPAAGWATVNIKP